MMMRGGRPAGRRTWARTRAAAGCGAGSAVLALAVAGTLGAGADARADVLDPGQRVFVGGEFLNEGFEDPGTFPPPGWSYVPLRSFPHDWHATTNPVEVHTGVGAAAVAHQDSVIQQEQLYAPDLDLQAESPAGMYLSFWYRADPFFFHGVDTVFRVHASLDGAAWTALFRLDDVTESGWAWRNVVVDLSSWAGVPGLLKLRFTYRGISAGDVAIDDVRVGYLTPPVPPPNDVCAGANAPQYTLGPTVAPFQVTGNTFFALHDYTLTLGASCTGHATEGRDLVWRVLVPPGHHFVATMTTAGNWDDSLFLVSDCANPEGTCVDGDRGFPDGATVAVPNAGGSTATYYLVASGWGTASGEFTLTGGIEPGIAVAPTSWGQIKAAYR